MDVLVLSTLLGAKFWSNGGVNPLFILKLVLLWKLLQSQNTVFQAVDRTHTQVCPPSTKQLADFVLLINIKSLTIANLAHFNIYVKVFKRIFKTKYSW